MLRQERADQAAAYGLHRRFPDWLIDELAAPHLCYVMSPARRCTDCRKQHAMRYSTDRCARRATTPAGRSAANRAFLFQECIAATIGNAPRSLNITEQSR